jgi:prevent-host-death family protein
MTVVKITAARSGFFDLFDKVARKHERIVIDRRGKDKVAMVPLEDLERLRALDDAADIAEADAALAESAERISYDEIRKELGL